MRAVLISVLVGFLTLSAQIDSPNTERLLTRLAIETAPDGDVPPIEVVVNKVTQIAVYDRFNALNSDDEYDIHCLNQAPTGSNVPIRTCAPNFVIRAEARNATKMLRDGRTAGTNNNNPAEHEMLMKEKSQKLTEEIKRVASQDEQLMRDLIRLDELKQLQTNDSRRAKR